MSGVKIVASVSNKNITSIRVHVVLWKMYIEDFEFILSKPKLTNKHTHVHLTCIHAQQHTDILTGIHELLCCMKELQNNY